MLTSYLPCVCTKIAESEDKGLLMAVVTCSGILIVFVILLLLIFIFYTYGGIFRAVTGAKEKKAAARKAAEEEKARQTVTTAPAEEPVPAEEGIPGEIIAVIAAAVAAMSDGKKYAVKKVSRAQRQTGGRSAWASSGIYENTRPF